jgi:hypothetical protein
VYGCSQSRSGHAGDVINLWNCQEKHPDHPAVHYAAYAICNMKITYINSALTVNYLRWWFFLYLRKRLKTRWGVEAINSECIREVTFGRGVAWLECQAMNFRLCGGEIIQFRILAPLLLLELLDVYRYIDCLLKSCGARTDQ